MRDKSEKFRVVQKPKESDYLLNRNLEMQIECSQALDPVNSQFIDYTVYQRMKDALINVVLQSPNRDKAKVNYLQIKDWMLMPEMVSIFYNDLKEANEKINR